MYTQVKSSSGISLIPIETRHLAERRIFIEEEIKSEKACEFAKQILLLNSEDKQKPIDVLLNSQGGEVNAGLFMYDVIQSSKAPIRMFCIGKAYSMAAVLFASGNNGRYILPHSKLMLHEPLLGNSISGKASSIQSISESLMQTKDTINQLLAKHTGRSVKEIEKATNFDNYYNAEEAIAFGLADKIVGFDFLLEV